jgi:PAS domain S-box-containing protein
MAEIDDRDKYHLLFDSIRDIVFFICIDGTIMEMNEAATKTYGYSKKELESMNIADLHIEEERNKLPGLLEGSFEHGCVFRTVHKRKDGSTFPAEINSRGILLHGEKELIGIVRNITESRRAEEALRKNEKFLNNVFNCIQDGVSVLSKDLNIISYNPTIEKWHGKDLTGKKCYRIFHGREEPCEVCPSIRAIREKTMQREIVHDLIGWKEIYAYPLVNDDGEVTGTIEQVRDITERKQAGDALRESEENFRAAFEQAAVGMTHANKDGRFMQVNQKFCDITGYSREELATLTVKDITYQPDMAREALLIKRLLAGELATFSREKRYVRKDGVIVWVNLTVTPIFHKGTLRYLMGITEDITERKRAEEELMSAKAQAELYVDLMGHDINNIHQAALGYLELFRDMPGDAREEYLDNAMEALKRSTRLINNVRKLQKFQDDRMQAYDADMCSVLREVHKEYEVVTGKAITLNLNGCTDCRVHADDLLRDVFSNLVGNAVKHTGDQAHVSINLDMVSEEGLKYCRVGVEDDGPGVSDGSKKTLFNRSLKGTPRAKGMGLGLYIVKTLVESYGGRVWVEDRVAGDHTKGARFVVMLPTVEK